MNRTATLGTSLFVLQSLALVGSTPARATSPIQLTTTGGVRPTASRDGNWIAYDQPGNTIMKLPSSGGSPTPLTTGREPNWERPGDLIVFRNGAIRTVDATTLAEQVVYSGSGFDDDPSWSPLGNEIAVQGSLASIAVIAYPAGTLSSIPCSDPDATGCEGEGPTWSPDGSMLAFEDGLDLLKVARGGGTAETLLHWDADLAQPAWSPDGRWIAVSLGNPDAIDSLTAAQQHLWLVDSRGSSFGLMQLTSGQVHDENPAWSPDGNAIYFNSTRSGSNEIWKLTTDVLPVKRITWGQVKSLYRR